MFKKCFIKSCPNNNDNNPSKIFITVPKNQEIRTRWIYAVNQKDVPKSVLFCCEDHFNLQEDAENFMQFKLMPTYLRMKKDVVPHLHISSPPLSEAVSQSQLSDLDRQRILDFQSRSKRRESQKNILSGVVAVPFMGPHFEISFIDLPIEQAKPVKKKDFPLTIAPASGECVNIKMLSPSNTLIAHHKDEPIDVEDNNWDHSVQGQPCENAVPQVQLPCKYDIDESMDLEGNRLEDSIQVQLKKPQNIELQEKRICKSLEVQSANIFQLFPQPINDNSSNGSQSSVTTSSISSTNSEFKRLNMQTIKNQFLKTTLQKLEIASRFYLGLPKLVYSVVKLLESSCAVSYTNILLTLKKIRLNDPSLTLELDFGLTIGSANKIFISTVPKLASRMRELIIWPSTAAIREILPTPFRTKYAKVESIIHFLEIEIERPSNVVHHALTVSKYKKCNTIKYLISSTPNGLINFMSCGFGGRTTNKNIMEHSGYCNILSEGAAVMTVRSYNQIATLLSRKHCTLVRPPSILADKCNSQEGVTESKRIAFLRKYIEGAIKRIREFNMLAPHVCLNSSFIGILDFIVIIVCAIVNLQDLD